MGTSKKQPKKTTRYSTVPVDKPLTYQEKRFVDALFQTTPPMNASEAARAVGVSQVSCRVASSRWMTKPNISAEIARRIAQIEKAADIKYEDWAKKMRGFFHSDVRKMFDEFGNPIEIPQLGDHEAMMIEGFEFVEDYTKVKKADGQTDAVPTGYTKKYKLTSKLKAMLEFGKVMGWCDGEGVTPGQGGTAPVNIQVVFVQGQAPKAEPKQINPAPQVAFVRR